MWCCRKDDSSDTTTTTQSEHIPYQAGSPLPVDTNTKNQSIPSTPVKSENNTTDNNQSMNTPGREHTDENVHKQEQHPLYNEAASLLEPAQAEGQPDNSSNNNSSNNNNNNNNSSSNPDNPGDNNENNVVINNNNNNSNEENNNDSKVNLNEPELMSARSITGLSSTSDLSSVAGSITEFPQALNVSSNDEELKTACAFLEKGSILTKHGRRGKPKPRLIFMHDSFLYWSEQQLRAWNKERCTTLADIEEIVNGKQTDIFKRSQAKKIDVNCCFSIKTRSRTIDLQAGTQQLRDQWVEALNVAWRAYNQQHAKQ